MQSNRRPVKKMTTVSLSMRIFLTLIVLFAIIFFATKLMENNKLKRERDALQEEIDRAKQKVSDLQYGIDAPDTISLTMEPASVKVFEYRI